MERPDDKFIHEWHKAINKFHLRDFPPKKENSRPWMYDAKNLCDEIPRMAMLFSKERMKILPSIHKQCLLSPSEKINDNHLTCCLGVECRKCEELLALEKADLPKEQIDQVKAWTCAAHILSAKRERFVDDTEGYLLTEDDKMFWSNVYESLAACDEGD